MKNLILFLMLFSSLLAHSQDSVWTKSKNEIYGSKSEKFYQDEIAKTSDNRFLCRYVGFKAFYDQGISDYLQSYEFSLDNAINSNGINTYILKKNGVYLGTKPVKVYISFKHDKNNRIISGSVKGPLTTLAAIFINYWPQDAVWRNTDQLKPGVAALKHCYGDLISFKWINGLPKIIISKDPNLVVPITTANMSK